MEEKYKNDGPLSPDGKTPWWQLEKEPGTKRKFGGERRVSAFLYFELKEGDSFTMRQLREAVGISGEPESAEHLNRRMRRLRDHGWVIDSHNDDRSLGTDTYRLQKKGRRYWLGERSTQQKVSAKTRRLVFERDGNTCVVCGVRAGDPYPEDPGVRARMTVGHRVPAGRLGGARVDDLQAECSRCNETVRDIVRNPERIDEVKPSIKGLKKKDLQELEEWLSAGGRSRTLVEDLYTRIRRLSAPEQEEALRYVKQTLGQK